MKKILLSLLSILAFVSCSKAQKTSFAPEALATKLTDAGGTQISFGDIIKKHNGKTTVIEIWASWCGDCVKAMPKLKELQANNPNVDYVFLSMDKTAEKWKTGIEKHNLDGDHYLVADGMKGAFGKSVDVDWIPRYIIIDKNGNILTYRAIETDFEQIDKTLKSQK
jgi:thiol-disulfide isomerase/thioredoxin